jgi:hypothetical protein
MLFVEFFPLLLLSTVRPPGRGGEGNKSTSLDEPAISHRHTRQGRRANAHLINPHPHTHLFIPYHIAGHSHCVQKIRESVISRPA